MSSAAVVRLRPRPRSYVAPCVAGSLVAALAAAGLGLALGDDSTEGWQLAARFTARLSFPIFLVAFTASSSALLFRSEPTRWILRSRRGIGLGFAAAHTVHLAALTTYSYLAGSRPDAVTLIFGGGAYLLMFAMAATSNDAAVGRLGRRWIQLHTLGAYWLWFVFAVSYAGRVAAGELAFAPQAALAVAALGVRIAASRRRRLRERRA